MKITGGASKGRNIIVPKGLDVRPPLSRTRQMIFSILGEAVRGARVLDLFSGCGSLGLEALSRGADSAVFVEKDSRALDAIHRNVEHLGLRARAFVARLDAMSIFRKPVVESRAPYALVFIDPPYLVLKDERERGRFLFFMERLASSPLLAPEATVVLRHETRVLDPATLTGWKVVRTREFGRAQWTILVRGA